MRRESGKGRPRNRFEDKSFRRTQRAYFSGTALLVLLFLFLGYQFINSYQDLRDAIQLERMDYVEEISEQIITSQRFMEQEYTIAVQNYAGTLNNAEISALGDVRNCLAGKEAEDILLVSPRGDVTALDGKAVFFPDRQFMNNMPTGQEVVRFFTSLNYAEDCWLFATQIEPIRCDGVDYNVIILTVQAEEFRDNLAISLFDSSGASYIINNDGSVRIKPAATNLTFDGYNLFSSMLQAGALEDEVSQLQQKVQDSDFGSLLMKIDGEDWLFSYSAIDGETSIVVAVPLAVTAALTYHGLSRALIFAAATVLAAALVAILLIQYFFYLDRRRSREAMAVAAKSDFFSKVSHDIRTPLNAVIGLELLARDSSDNPQVREYLDQSSAAAAYLLGIINDVLDMSRIESGKLSINRAPFDMNALLAEVRSVISQMAMEKSLDFDVEMEAPFRTTYLGDQVRLKQVLVNLLSNSVKFTRTGGHVKLQLSHSPGEEGRELVTIVVSDNGIGMSEEYLARIFKPFEQERSSYTEQSVGSGLGLAIVHSLVTMMGGEISVESREGEGSVFTVQLPLERSPEPLPDGEKSAAAPIMDFTGRRVLLAEDNIINQQVAVAILRKKFSLTVEVAADGRAAVDMVAAAGRGYYDLVLMDVKMPVMDGLEATRQIRALPRPDAKDIPIVALSANAFEEDVVLSLNAGMNQHLAKPIDIAALSEVLKNYIVM